MRGRDFTYVLCFGLSFSGLMNADSILVGTGLTAIPTNQAGLLTTQYLAQSFTLNTAVEITSVEVLIGGFGDGRVLLQLTNALGPGAGPSNVLAQAELDVPNTVFPAGQLLSFATDLDVDAGTYYLVASSIVQGGWWPMVTSLLPSRVGSVGFPFFTPLGGANAFAPASTWILDNCLQCTRDGFRIRGETEKHGSAVPEPSTILLFTTALLFLNLYLLNGRLRHHSALK